MGGCRVPDDRRVESAAVAGGVVATATVARSARHRAGTASNEKKDRRAPLSLLTFFEPAGYLRRDLVNQSGYKARPSLVPDPEPPGEARKPAQPAALEAAK